MNFFQSNKKHVQRRKYDKYQKKYQNYIIKNLNISVISRISSMNWETIYDIKVTILVIKN